MAAADDCPGFPTDISAALNVPTSFASVGDSFLTFSLFKTLSKADSASTAATPPVTEAVVSSTALSNAANRIGGYTAGTLRAMIFDCVKWVFTGQQALKQAKEWQMVLGLAQPKRHDAHDAPSCPLLKFITTEASQGGVIALTITKSLDSMT